MLFSVYVQCRVRICSSLTDTFCYLRLYFCIQFDNKNTHFPRYHEYDTTTVFSIQCNKREPDGRYLRYNIISGAEETDVSLPSRNREFPLRYRLHDIVPYIECYN